MITLLPHPSTHYIELNFTSQLLKIVCIYLFTYYLFRATPAAYGSAQARGGIGAAAAGLHYSHSSIGIWATFVTYTSAYGNTRSLTHWERPGIEPTSSWTLVGLLTTEPQQDFPILGLPDH